MIPAVARQKGSDWEVRTSLWTKKLTAPSAVSSTTSEVIDLREPGVSSRTDERARRVYTCLGVYWNSWRTAGLGDSRTFGLFYFRFREAEVVLSWWSMRFRQPAKHCISEEIAIGWLKVGTSQTFSHQLHIPYPSSLFDAGNITSGHRASCDRETWQSIQVWGCLHSSGMGSKHGHQPQ